MKHVMNRSFGFALALAASVALSACDNTATPQGVVGAAAKALAKNDVKKFPKFLTGTAKEKYGDLEGMIALQKLLKPYTAHQVGETKLVATTSDDHGRPTLRNYTVQIVGKQGTDADLSQILVADVACTTDYRVEYDHGTCGPASVGYSGPMYGGNYVSGPGYYYEPGVGGGFYGPCGVPFAHTVESTYCLISDVE
ncbi:MAG TPA: hypothetical protein VL588_08775 [Bdellovibrionota bacterium]|jgi:hypothetical protein|nr:hypothetical protein [Bdellovibrionota bacterium]